MKYFIHILLLIVLFANPKILLGQKSDQSKYSLQLNIGFSKTLHYNPPVSLFQCIELCFPEEQKPRITHNVNVNLYRDFNQKNSLKIGFGSSNYRYWERGQANVGSGGIFGPYESIGKWSFYGLSIGYRYIFNPEKKVRIFIESDIIYEIPVHNYDVFKKGIAIQPKIGAIVNLSSKWSLVGEGFYKSALTSYGKGFRKDYKPYAYGIQFGVNLKI